MMRSSRMGKALAVFALGFLIQGCGIQGGTSASSGQTATLPPVPHSPNPHTFMHDNIQHKTATLTMDADYNNENGGFDFDGYSFGELTIQMPENYTVTVNFTNDGNMPHSVGLVKAGAENPTGPIIKGAAIPQAVAGLPPGSTATFSFRTPSHPAHYELACLVPGHIAVGMYVNFDVISGPKPSMVVGKP